MHAPPKSVREKILLGRVENLDWLGTEPPMAGAAPRVSTPIAERLVHRQVKCPDPVAPSVESATGGRRGTEWHWVSGFGRIDVWRRDRGAHPEVLTVQDVALYLAACSNGAAECGTVPCCR